MILGSSLGTLYFQLTEFNEFKKLPKTISSIFRRKIINVNL